MRILVDLGGTLAGLALLVSPLRADDRAAAQAVIERAIKAHGGAEGLAKAQTVRRTGNGTISVGGSELPFTDEQVAQLPDRLRVTVEIDKRTRLTIAINGAKGWQSTGGATVELPKERLDELREEAYAAWLTTLVPLTKGSFDVAVLPETKVSDRPALGIKATSKGHEEARLYFDKESGLLVKLERPTKEAGLAVTKDYVYSDFKDFTGVKLPTRQVLTLNGTKFSELTVTEYKFLTKVDESTFTKP